MIVACHQPNFLPWIGFFYKAVLGDVVVLLDDVQFARGFTWVNRNRLKGDQGELWLTVPVKKRGRGLQKIREVEIFNDRNWHHKAFQSIIQQYAHAPYLNEHRSFLQELLQASWERLVDLNIAALRYLVSNLGIKNNMLLHSALQIQSSGSELLVQICKTTGATCYLAPQVSKKYLQEDIFARQGIAVKFFKFTPPLYPQLWGEFIYNLSALDMLLTCGEKSLAIINHYNRETEEGGACCGAD